MELELLKMCTGGIQETGFCKHRVPYRNIITYITYYTFNTCSFHRGVQLQPLGHTKYRKVAQDKCLENMFKTVLKKL